MQKAYQGTKSGFEKFAVDVFDLADENFDKRADGSYVDDTMEYMHESWVAAWKYGYHQAREEGEQK